MLQDEKKKYLSKDNRFVFLGAGWRHFYYLGVCHYLQLNFSSQHMKEVKFEGTSAGAWVSLIMIVSYPAVEAKEYWSFCSQKQRKKQGFFQQIYTRESLRGAFDIMGIKSSDLLDISKRLTVCISRFDSKLHVDYFSDTKELFQVLMASSFLPMITGKSLFYRYKDSYCFDGYFSSAIHDKKDVVISMSKKSKNFLNIYPESSLRGMTFFPPSVEEIDDMFMKGYKDAEDKFRNVVIKTS